MASAVVKEPEINNAQLYAEFLIDYYIPEYYQPGGLTDKNTTEDPNDGEQEWNKQFDRLLLLHFTTSNTKLKSEQQLACKKEVRQLVADIFPYVDVLRGNHLVAIASTTLGLLPLWVTSEIKIYKGH
jgi:hypothetical protein